MFSIKKERSVLVAVPLVLFCSFLTGIVLPIYSDEVVTKFNVARFFLESGGMVTFYPQCTSTVGHAVAWVFYPAAILISSVYAHLGPFGIRLTGIAFALIWFGLLAYWCRKQEQEGWLGRFTALTAFASLGVLPFLWVMSRSEQFMFLPVLLACLLALDSRSVRSTYSQSAIALGLGLLLSAFFYSHPKSVFFAPFFIAAVWYAARGPKMWIRIALILYVAALSSQALRDANLLAACHDAPAVQALLEANTLLPRTLINEPSAFIASIAKNVISFPERMLRHLTYSPEFQSGWLPPLTESPDMLRWLNPLIYVTLFIGVVGSHFLAFAVAAFGLVCRRLSVPALLASLLAAGDLANLALYKIQNFYAGIQYVPLSIVVLALLFQLREPGQQWGPFVRAAAKPVLAFLVGLALLSQYALHSLVTPNLLRNADYADASLPGQPLSVPVLGAEGHLESILELGGLCHIPRYRANSVVVDHMTYFAYLENKSPIHVLYVSEFGYGADLLRGRLVPFLKKLNSPGLIARCEWVPTELRAYQRSNERGYCCVNLRDVDRSLR